MIYIYMYDASFGLLACVNVNLFCITKYHYGGGALPEMWV